MESEFINRLDRCHRSLAVLALPEHKSVWNNQPPLIFTDKVAEAQLMVKAIEETQKKQEAGLGGFTAEKDREETELEDAAFALAQALVQYYTDHHDESEAGAFDLPISDWRKLRDQQLLAKSQLVLDRVGALSVGGTATVAAKYGLTPAAAQALTKERADYDAILNAPDAAVAVRKALTQGFRPAFRLLDRKFAELDRLIVQFRVTEAGRALVAAWKAARLVRDLGTGHRAPPAATPPPATPPGA